MSWQVCPDVCVWHVLPILSWCPCDTVVCAALSVGSCDIFLAILHTAIDVTPTSCQMSFLILWLDVVLNMWWLTYRGCHLHGSIFSLSPFVPHLIFYSTSQWYTSQTFMTAQYQICKHSSFSQNYFLCPVQILMLVFLECSLYLVYAMPSGNDASENRNHTNILTQSCADRSHSAYDRCCVIIQVTCSQAVLCQKTPGRNESRQGRPSRMTHFMGHTKSAGFQWAAII